jgi:TetR/AcrR family transcriptional regulator
MEEIAADARIAKGTLYLSFASKEDLFVMLMCRGLGLLREQCRSAVAKTAGAIENLTGLGDAFVRFHDQHPEHFRLIHDGAHGISASEVSPEVLQSLHQSSGALWGLFAEVLQEGIDDGSLRNDVSAFEMAIILWTNLSGMLRQADALRQPSVWQSAPLPYSMHALDTDRLLALSRSIVLNGLTRAS